MIWISCVCFQFCILTLINLLILSTFPAEVEAAEATVREASVETREVGREGGRGDEGVYIMLKWEISWYIARL